MLEAILDYRWQLLGIFEVLAWTVTFLLFYVRYRLQSLRWFRILSVLFFCTGVIPLVSLGLVNFYQQGEVDGFTLVIVLLLLYGATLGRRQVWKLDRWAKRRFSPKKSQQSAASER